jgi:hypothetical protein
LAINNKKYQRLSFIAQPHAKIHQKQERAEKADERLGQLRASAARVVSEEKASARKARNHRLIQQGLLFDLAGLEQRSRGELLGLLLAAAKTEDPQRWAHWKEAGDALLAEKGDAAG